jgi:hypothetical protein
MVKCIRCSQLNGVKCIRCSQLNVVKDSWAELRVICIVTREWGGSRLAGHLFSSRFVGSNQKHSKEWYLNG